MNEIELKLSKLENNSSKVIRKIVENEDVIITNKELKDLLLFLEIQNICMTNLSGQVFSLKSKHDIIMDGVYDYEIEGMVKRVE
jgi:hypothetical protein